MTDLFELTPPLFHRFRIIGKLIHNKNLNILDIGCGDNVLLEQLLKDSKIIGLDISSEALLKAKKKAPNAVLIRGDINHLPIKDNCIGICAMLAVLGAVQRGMEIRAFEESNRVLKKGGGILILVSNDHFVINRLAIVWVLYRWRHFKPQLVCSQLKKAGFQINDVILTAGILSEFIDTIYDYWRWFWHYRLKRTDEPPVPLKRIILRLTELEFRVEKRRITPARFIYIKAYKI